MTGGSSVKNQTAKSPGAEATELRAMSFEEALGELESVASKLEGGGVGLEESLGLLRRGMALIERCEGELSEAESVLEQLIVNEDGDLETVRISGGA